MMREVPKYILAYALWVVSIVLGFFVAYIARQTVTVVMDISRAGAAEVDQFDLLMQRNAVDRFGVIILAIVLLVVIVATEHMYRTGVQRGTLMRSFFLVTAVELGILFVFHLIFFISGLRVGILTAASGLIQLIELVLLLLFIWLYRRQKTRPLLAL